VNKTLRKLAYAIARGPKRSENCARKLSVSRQYLNIRMAKPLKTGMTVLMVSKMSKRKRMASERITGYILALVGILALVLSIAYVSSILAFIGLGLTFWGALLLYLKNERYVKTRLLDSTALSSLENLSKIIKELDYKGRAVYLPPKYLRDFKSGLVYIPKKEETEIPSVEEVSEEKTFSKNPQGIFLTPPGLNLTHLFEKELETDFVKTDLPYLQKNMPKLFIENLEIAQDSQIETQNSIVNVEITGSVYKDFCTETRKLQNICGSIGCPLCSAIACALAMAVGKPIIIEKDETSEDNKTITIQYRILEE